MAHRALRRSPPQHRAFGEAGGQRRSQRPVENDRRQSRQPWIGQHLRARATSLQAALKESERAQAQSEHAQAQSEHARAGAERAQAQSEHARAEAERRAEALAEELRRLRAERDGPDSFDGS